MRHWAILLLFMSYLTPAASLPTAPFMPTSNTLPLQHYTTKQGLSGNAIRSLFEDKQGILWVGTNKGVSLFDGQSFRPLVLNRNHPLSSAIIFDITQHTDDSFWIATHYRGVFHYFPKTKHWVQYGANQDKKGLMSPVVRKVLIDDIGTVWVGTDLGLHRYDPQSDRFAQILDPANDSLLANHISNIVAPDSNHLWLGTDNGLVYFDKTRLSFKRFNHQQNNPKSLINDTIESLLLDDSQKLWIGTNNGLATTISSEGVFDNITAKKDNPHGLCANVLNTLMFDKNQRLWVGSNNNGLCIGDGTAKRFNAFKHSTDDNETLRTNKVNDIIEDRWGNVWLATNGALSLLKQDIAGIEVMAIKSDIGRSISIQTLYHAPDNTLILVSAKQTLKVNDSDMKARQSVPLAPGQSIAYSIYLPQQGVFAFKTNDPVLYQLDETSLQYLPTPFVLSTKLAPYNNISLHKVKNGQLAVATPKNAHLITLKDFSVKTLFGDITMHPPSGVVAIYQQEQRLWTCPSQHQFTAFDLPMGKWEPVNSTLTPSESLKCNRLIDSEKGVWGISLRTVFRLGPTTNKVLNELSEPGVSTVIEIKDNLWLIKSDELVRYNLSGGQKIRIGLAQLDNVTHSARNNSYYDDRRDQLYIPLSNRLLRINLNQISPQDQPLKVNLREFSLFNHPVDISQDPSIIADAAIAYAQSVQLDYSQYMFQLHFAADSLTNTEGIYYRYRLKGFDKHWIDTPSDKTFALYSGVSDGHYEFEVQATRNRQNWPSTSKKMTIIITPPWWQAWWAYLLYFMAITAFVLSLLWLVYRHQMAEKDKKSLLEIASAKEQFFANISHEFRTPLTLILGPVTTVREQTKEAKTRKTLLMVERNAQRLTGMVDQILDLARLQGFENTTMQSQNLTAAVDFIVQSFQPLVSAQHIALIIENHATTELWVEVLPDALEKILTNLISNACKYSDNGATVTIILNVTPQNQLIMGIHDTGKGMSPADLAMVFDRFTRIDESSHNTPGTGIGLALVKELVQYHNGTITVTSEPGVGSEFTVTLPLSEPMQQSQQEQPTINTQVIEHSIALLHTDDTNNLTSAEQDTPEQSAKTSILIIEDNADMRQYIISLLEDSYYCLCADNGLQGMEQAINHVPDLIISDVMMPGIDGFEVAKRVRSEECTSHIPLILLTAKDDIDSRMQGWQQNIDDYIAKPFHQQELLLRVENLLSIRSILRKRFGQEVAKGNLLSGAKPDQLGDKNLQFIEKFEAMISENYTTTNFSRAKAASLLAMSERQLHRKLSALIDHNFSEYLRKYRLRQACELLGRGFQIGRISAEVGFSSNSYFSSCFRAQYGMTVKQYEKNKMGSD